MINYDEQIAQADHDVRQASPEAIFVSQPGKFMVSVEEAHSFVGINPGLMINHFEWGEFREDIAIFEPDVTALRDALTAWLEKNS